MAKTAFSLIITGAPWTTQAPQSALFFARAALAQGYGIQRLFLYGDGVGLANRLQTPPTDETHWLTEWQTVLHEHGIPAFACVASALRRGILNEEEARRHQQTADNLASPFQIAGLGEWIEGLGDSRVLYFHGGD